MNLRRFALGVLLCHFGWGTVSAADPREQWGHWRGPAGNGVSLDAKPPLRWSETENIQWKVAIPGSGSGSPVVWEQRVFVVAAVPTAASSSGEQEKLQQSPQQDGPSDPQGLRNRNRRGFGRGGRAEEAGDLQSLDFQLHCFDRSTGKLLWTQTAVTAVPHEGTHQTNNFAPASPCTDGEHVYAHFGSRGLFCYSLDGDLIWERQFGQMRCRNGFGEGSSPTLAGELILVPWDHEGPSFLYALDKKTGAIRWQTPRDEPTNWSTPLVVRVAEESQVILNGQNKVRAYDLNSGEELWSCGGQTARPAASAVAGHGLVYVGSGFQGSFLAAFRPQGRGDLEGSENVVWSLDRDTPDVPSPLLSGERIYFYKGRSGLLTCLNAITGKPYYSAVRVPGLTSIYASPIAAGGHVYLSDRDGNVVVIEDADALTVVATNSLSETIDATPAAAGNQLFIRTAKHLYCVAEKGE